VSADIHQRTLRQLSQLRAHMVQAAGRMEDPDGNQLHWRLAKLPEGTASSPRMTLHLAVFARTGLSQAGWTCRARHTLI
jgi:hypothetical protein